MSGVEQYESRRRVFLAEDDDEMRELLQLALSRTGFEVVAASTGDELLARLARTTNGARPDAVVTDLRMPGRDGMSVLAEVRRNYPDVPVVLITAFGEDAVHARALELGAACVLDKPVALDELRHTLEQLTSG